MTAFIERKSPDFFVIKISGLYTNDDLKTIQNFSKEKPDNTEKVKVLILVNDFKGWAKDGDWGDLTFLQSGDPYVSKIAVVAEQKWHDEFLMFLGAGRRQASVDTFTFDEEQDAIDWLNDKLP